MIIISAADYRDAWDVILAWPDERDQLQVIWHFFAARDRGGPLPSIDVADALLDERRELRFCSGYFA